MNATYAAFLDEITKLAANVRGLHATTGRWKVLTAKAARPAAYDPNPPGLYLAAHRRGSIPLLEAFAADKAAATPGREALVAKVRFNTKEGTWVPRPRPDAAARGVGFDDLMAALDDIEDKSLSRAERGKAWRLLNENVGAWYSPDGRAKVLAWIKSKAR